ncbi:MAG: hypothetical protein J0H36_03900, partial [Hyphomicrobium denitrificans]|nr:hypothetical protein [Hyphomicrobium denitrificans]
MLLASAIVMGNTFNVAAQNISSGTSKDLPSMAGESQAADIIPVDRRTTWTPGLSAIGGIPVRTVIYRTLAPRGGTGDDTATIQHALDT